MKPLSGIPFEERLKKQLMSTIKNLTKQEAIEKLKTLAEGKMCLLCMKKMNN